MSEATVEMAQTSCATCGLVFWVPKAWDNARREKHDGWWCPNGHSLVYRGATEADRLRKQLETAQSCCNSQKARAASLEEALEHRERQIRGYKGKVGQLKRRAQAAEQ